MKIDWLLLWTWGMRTEFSFIIIDHVAYSGRRHFCNRSVFPLCSTAVCYYIQECTRRSSKPELHCSLCILSEHYPHLWNAKVNLTIVWLRIFLCSLFIFSPQVINKHPLSNTLDIWSMACLSSQTMISSEADRMKSCGKDSFFGKTK